VPDNAPLLSKPTVEPDLLATVIALSAWTASGLDALERCYQTARRAKTEYSTPELPFTD
jgi:hypothetical protein